MRDRDARKVSQAVPSKNRRRLLNVAHRACHHKKIPSRFAVERLEGRTLLSGTPIPIVNSDFETVYKTGTTITGTFPGGAGSFGQAPFGPDAKVVYQVNGVPYNPATGGFDQATVNFSDSSTGSFVDIPGWTAPSFPATYGGVKSELPQVNINGVTGQNLYPGGASNVLYLDGPVATRGFPNTYGYGPSFQTVTQTLTTDVQPNTLYTMSVDIGWEGDLNTAPNNPSIIVNSVYLPDGTTVNPNLQLVIPIIANVQADGKTLTMVSTNYAQVLQNITPGTFQTLTETFLSGATVPANTPLTVVLGLGPNSNASGNQTDFDNVKLSSQAVPATSNLQAAISAPDVTSSDPTTPLPSEQIVVTYSSTDGATIDAGSIGTGNLLITSPYGATIPVGSVVSSVPNGANGSLTVTYDVPAPDGNFTAADNGTYTVTTIPGTVTANSGAEAVAINTSTFNVTAASNTMVNLLKDGTGSIGFTVERLVNQADGKTIVAGHNGYAFDFSSESDAVLQRFNTDGSVDTTFGTEIQGNIAELGPISAFFGVAVQSNGDIVAVGTENGDMLVARFDSSGNLDPSFANNGIFLAGIGGNSSLSSVEISPDGKIVAGGSNASGDYVLVRLDSDGAPDATFNPGGVNNSVVPINIAGGTAKELLQGKFLTANGGELRLSAGQTGNAVDQIVLVPNADGVPADYQIYAVGNGTGNVPAVPGSTTQLTGSQVVAVIGVDSTGNPGTFGGDVVPTGTKAVSVSGLELVTQLIPESLGSDVSKSPVGIAVQSDGKIIVVAGATDPTNPNNTDFGVARLDSTGHLDPSFGANGIVITPFQNSQAYGNSVSVDPTTGQIIVYGTSYGAAGFETALAVYTSAGVLDPTFDIPGNTPGTLALPSGLTTSRAFHPLSIDVGITNGLLNRDGSITVTTTDATVASASSIRRLQIVYPFPQLSSNAVVAINNKSTTQFTVVYTAPGGRQIDTTTLADNNLTVTGPNGVVPVTLVSTGLANAAVVSAVYQIGTPSGGDWSPNDAGNYTVSLTGTVNDTSGKAVQTGNFGTFTLTVASPLMGVAQLSSTAVTTTTTTSTTQFTVMYTATAGAQIDVSSLANSNLTVTGPNGVVPVTLFSTGLANAQMLSVVYQITAPGGGNWLSSDAGNYAVSVAGAVTDTNGNVVQTGNFGTFALAVITPPLMGDLALTPPAGKVAATVVGGSKSKGSFKVVVTNNGQAAINGLVDVTLYVSTANDTINGAAPFGVLARKVKIPIGKKSTFLVKGQSFPLAGGSFYLLAAANYLGNPDSNLAATLGTVTVVPPFVDLSNLAVVPVGKTITSRRNALFVTVQNIGNVLASGTATVTISAVANGASIQVAAVPVRLHLNPGQKQRIRVSYTPTSLPAAGSYNLNARIDLAADANTANNSAVSLLQVTV